MRSSASWSGAASSLLTARQSAHELAASGGLDVHEPVECVLVRRPGLSQQLASRPSQPGVVWARSAADVSAAVVRASSLPTSRDVPQVLSALGLGRRLVGLDRATRIDLGPTVGGVDLLATAYAGAMVALRIASASDVSVVVDWHDLGPVALLGVARDDDLAWALLAGLVRAFLVGASPTWSAPGRRRARRACVPRGRPRNPAG